MQTKVIGLHGPKRSGKDTVGSAILQVLEFCGIDACRYAIASPIVLMVKSLVCNVFGFDSAAFDRIAASDEKDTFVFPGVNATYRQLSTTLGTEWGRDLISPSLWVDATAAFIARQSGVVVVTDVRMENEAAMLRAMGGVIVHISRPGYGIGCDHRSENGIRFVDGDIRLVNDGCLHDLHEQVKLLLIGLSLGNTRSNKVSS